jgi:prepilin-type N-terminal cleavage/methylation domain-containing protein/prepilin-type processing-associated H-X9-DG protein
MNVRRAGRLGFTLVELLVVIGIIAVLVGILLPVLGNARKSAASVKCLSNLRNLGNAFLMYAGDSKNAYPVARQDVPEINGIPQNLNPPNGLNLYWHDMLYFYLKRNSTPLHDQAKLTKEDLVAYRKSVMWCPTWEIDRQDIDLNNAYNERFKTGYAFNPLLGFRADYPKPDANLPHNGAWPVAARSVAVWTKGPGRYYKKNEISEQANRALVLDSNAWAVGLNITNAAGDLAGQAVGTAGYATIEDGNSPTGAMNVDLFRHGKYPGNAGGRYDTKGGKIAYNVLFADGHCATLNSAQDGYRAIRMKYP